MGKGRFGLGVVSAGRCGNSGRTTVLILIQILILALMLALILALILTLILILILALALGSWSLKGFRLGLEVGTGVLAQALALH